MVVVALKQFILDKQSEWGRDIKNTEIHEATGISNQALSRALSDDSLAGIKMTTADKLCKFFGVPAGPVPFIIYTPDKEDAESQETKT